MIDYLIGQSRVTETYVAALTRPRGSRFTHEKFQCNKLESWLSCVSDASFSSGLKVCKRLSEKS